MIRVGRTANRVRPEEIKAHDADDSGGDGKAARRDAKTVEVWAKAVGFNAFPLIVSRNAVGGDASAVQVRWARGNRLARETRE